MPNRIKPKRSYTANSVPLTTDLEPHELAINWVDGKAFTKDGSGNIVTLTLGGSGGGGGGGGGGSFSIVSAATTQGFPGTGSAANLYVATDTRRLYSWDSSGVYVELGPTGAAGVDLSSYFLPPAPTNLAATAGNAQVALTWTAPTVLTQMPITDYVVQFKLASASEWSTFADGTSTTASATVTGLTNGLAYVFRVAGVNGVGTGAYTAATSSVTPQAAGGITMGNRYVAGVLGAYTTWTISGDGTSGSPAVGTMRGDVDTSEWRFTAIASGTLTITARNVSQSEGWGNWYVRTVGGATNLAQGDSTTSNVTRTVSVTSGTQYAIRTDVGGVDFSMSIA